MRVRGAAALAMLGVAMACGGHTRSSAPDDLAAGGSRSGGTPGRGGAASAGTPAIGGGSGQLTVGGSGSSGGREPCLCVGVGCADGFVWVADPNECCIGECVLACDNSCRTQPVGPQ